MSPRSADLKPKESASRKAAGLAAWVVSVPPSLSETGKRRQIFFRTKNEARSLCEHLKIMRDNFGYSLNYLTPARLTEAGEAYKILKPLGVRLLDAVREYADRHKARTASVTFLVLFDEYLEVIKDRHPRYREQLRITRNRLPALHDRLASDIEPREIEDLLRPLTSGARNSIMRYLRTIFNYGIKRGYLADDNPILRLNFAPRPRQEVGTIPHEDVSKMLHYALEHDLGLLPYLTLGFFCGIRPENELLKLEWSDLKGSEIVIRPGVSKTHRRRFVDISANAQAWLDAYGAAGGVMTGRVMPYALRNLQRRHRALRKAAGVTHWVQDGARHTYCSNWLAVHKDVNRLVLMSGHDSADTMWRHYHKGVTEEEAKSFWNIRPPEIGERKIIRL